MPQERPNHYGHLLPGRHTLSDGTDISKKTVDQIKMAQRRADEEFFTAKRKISPRFPDVAEALERRRCLRETIAARTMIATGVAGGLYALITGETFGLVVLGFSIVGFITTCFVAGNRQYVRSGRGGGHGQRPF